jgi:hypothetical protein
MRKGLLCPVPEIIYETTITARNGYPAASRGASIFTSFFKVTWSVPAMGLGLG